MGYRNRDISNDTRNLVQIFAPRCLYLPVYIAPRGIFFRAIRTSPRSAYCPVDRPLIWRAPLTLTRNTHANLDVVNISVSYMGRTLSGVNFSDMHRNQPKMVTMERLSISISWRLGRSHGRCKDNRRTTSLLAVTSRRQSGIPLLWQYVSASG
jgi:hypothetical protein